MRYNETVGPSTYSEADAAQQADVVISAAMQAAQGGGTIWSDLDRIYLDFGNMSEFAMEQDSVRYDDVRDQLPRDIKMLYEDCSAG